MSITVIIPCFNAEAFLADAIESVLCQTRQADEVIVVDDCSTDASREIAARYPVRLLQTPRNAGHPTARNQAIEAATGDVIAWLDADDYWESNHLEAVVGLLDRHPEADVAFSAVRCFGTQSRLWTHDEPPTAPANLFWECFHNTMVPAMSAVTRTAAIRGVGGFDTTINAAPDFDLWLRLARTSTFIWTNEVTANYRWHPGQVSSTRPLAQRTSQAATRYRMWRQLHNEGRTVEADRAAEIIRGQWDAHLLAAWAAFDRKQLSEWLGMEQYIPGSTDLGRAIGRRLRIPGWPSPFWDKAAQAVRALLGQGRRTNA
jgi:glycosyltransferase involved in cell wall biosynthesis